MAQILSNAFKRVEFLDVLDILRNKFCEQLQKYEDLENAHKVILNENKQLHEEITKLKNLPKQPMNFSEIDVVPSLETYKINTGVQRNNEDEFIQVINETFCSESNETQCFAHQSTSFKEFGATSPIISSKFRKPSKHNTLTPLVDGQPIGSNKLENSISSWNFVPDTPFEYSKSIFTFEKSFENMNRPPLMSTENSPKFKSRKEDYEGSPILFNNSDDNIINNKNLKVPHKAKSNYKTKGNFKKPTNTKMKQISVKKCFKRSKLPSPDKVFNFEDSDVMNQNISNDSEMNKSIVLLHSPENGSLFNIFVKSSSKSPDSQRISPVRKKLDFNITEAVNSKDYGKNSINKSTSIQKNAEVDSSFLFVRDPVRKKADRKRLQGWACEECRKYYEGANFTESQMQAKINECSKHRDDRNPFASNTPPGYWNPEFPPTQEINKTQTAHKISSK